MMREVGIPDEEWSHLALDHIIALTLGGHPLKLSAALHIDEQQKIAH